MTNIRLALPKPEVKGVGEVLYRCAACGEVSPPDKQAVVAGKSYHPHHVPKEDDPRGR